MAYPVPTANTASTMAPVRDLKNDLDCCGTFGAGTAGVVGATTLLDVRAGTAGAAATASGATARVNDALENGESNPGGVAAAAGDDTAVHTAIPIATHTTRRADSLSLCRVITSVLSKVC